MFGLKGVGYLRDSSVPDPATDAPHVGSTITHLAGRTRGDFRTRESERYHDFKGKATPIKQGLYRRGERYGSMEVRR